MTAPHPSPPSSTAVGSVHGEPTAKRIRVVLAGHILVDSISARLVWEHQYYPHYYIPAADVANGVLIPTNTTSEHDGLGRAHYFNVRVGGTEVTDGAWQYPEAQGWVR
ncbi:MAG: DUF427 domain-containing protein [Actinomycetia bacterium]|nr:DUF427 domain-containing protein [Actinomycetes bacterium]